jgi:radical SAM protein with 4Fe4S-binding SPASM domain
MYYFLSRNAVLKWLEVPSVYHIKKDDLYELDDDSFHFLKSCISDKGCNTNDKNFIRYCLEEDILTKDKVILRRPPFLKAHEPSLRYLELQITNKCNLRCKHCYIGDADLSELSMNQVENILTEFEEMQGLRVLITGGEPLVHNKFREINEMLPDFFLRKVLFTNGLLLNKNILGQLNVDEIQVSIDGLEDAHDSLRGRGAYKAALKAAKQAIDSGFEVSVATMVHRKNLDDFDEMDRLFKRMGVKDWTVDIPCKTGRLEYNNEFHLSPELGGKYFRYGYGSGLHAGASGYACGLHLMAVMADGKVAKCSFYADNPVGVIEDGLGKCWQRIKPVRIEELQCDCGFVEECRGGCRYRAKLFGDPLGKDLYKCNFYDKINR